MEQNDEILPKAQDRVNAFLDRWRDEVPQDEEFIQDLMGLAIETRVDALEDARRAVMEAPTGMNHPVAHGAASKIDDLKP